MKKLTITDKTTKETYELFFTREVVSDMESKGFVISEFQKKPISMSCELFYNAFKAKQPHIGKALAMAMWEQIENKGDFVKSLMTLYTETFATLMTGSPDGESANEGNLTWELTG